MNSHGAEGSNSARGLKDERRVLHKVSPPPNQNNWLEMFESWPIKTKEPRKNNESWVSAMIKIKQITAIFNWNSLLTSFFFFFLFSCAARKLICFTLHADHPPSVHARISTHSIILKLSRFVSNFFLQHLPKRTNKWTDARWSSLSRTMSSTCSGTCAWPCSAPYFSASSFGTYERPAESRRLSGIALCSTIVYWPSCRYRSTWFKWTTVSWLIFLFFLKIWLSQANSNHLPTLLDNLLGSPNWRI